MARSNTRVIIHDDRISLWVDEQHISNINADEAAHLICQLLIFEPEVREKVIGWINKGIVSQVGEYLAPSKPPFAGIPSDSQPFAGLPESQQPSNLPKKA